MGACNALASTIQKLHRLRNAPKELEELENEINALKTCTGGIDRLVQMHSGNGVGLVCQTSLGVYIENARKKIQEIQRILEHSLLDTSSSRKIRASAWLKWQPEFHRLRQGLRDLRSEIGTCISLFNAAGTRSNEVQLAQLALDSRAMYDVQLKTFELVQEELVRQKPVLAMEHVGRTMQTADQEPTFSARQPTTTRSNSENLSSRPLGLVRPRRHSNGSSMVLEDDIETIREITPFPQGSLTVRPQLRQRPAAVDGMDQCQATGSLLQQEPTMSLQVSYRQKDHCRRPCSCQCHRSSKFKTPDFLRQVTGQLLVGYAGISSITPPCNEHACAQRQKAAVRIQYNFPVWSLIQRMLTLVSYSSGACGPEKSLRMSRVRPGLDEVFIQVQSGNVRRLQQLFIQGDASPLDASDTGWTLLHYALTAGQLPTVKFLKDAGADVRAESTNRQTPIEIAWNRILSGSLDGTSEGLLRAVFDDDAQLDERQFTTLHKIVLGMTGKLLAEELDLTTAYINALDSSGNTPLAWASARGDHQSVDLLLKHGASLSIANDVDAKPIHLAAQTGNINTIQALVKGGADINSVVRQTNMTPIHYAAEYQNSYGQIEGLASLGAHVDGRDYLEWTPLHWASWRGHLASLNALIDHGANINAKTLDGNASIMLAVANNSHECVQRLIELGVDCSVVRASQWNILHYAAIGGSIDTICSLRRADISGCDLETLKTKDTGQSVIDMLSTRLDALSEDPAKREAWKFAWDRLMVDSEPDLVRPLTRSDTDNTYVDADDTLFANRENG
ncbi:MAG: hypothetical protein Q9181_002023 [Wetmoreana brouardii]